ncbi:MAG: NRDE family protein, partial [Deltaproteobacteria bacterium]|nr:NRDE family protein [Deltaproteobacteria bacterium]MBW2673299.1 NRDE family protein [Deltaproteobacteria bacterium]
DVYGTRSSTVILIDTGGNVRFIERSFSSGTGGHETAQFEFRVQAGADTSPR